MKIEKFGKITEGEDGRLMLSEFNFSGPANSNKTQAQVVGEVIARLQKDLLELILGSPHEED